MSSRLTPRDFEILSTYLDGQLTGSERTRLESRLLVETELQTTLEEMRRTRSILRAAPTLRAPRNYTLKPDMVKVHRQVPRFYPILRLASALASILFVLAFAGDLISRAAPVQAPEEAPVALVQEDAALTTASVEGASESAQELMQSKAPPASADGPAQGSLPAQTGIETTNQPMLAMEMMAASPDATQTGVARTPESEDALREMPETLSIRPALQTDTQNQGETMPATRPAWTSSLRIFEIIVLVFAIVTGLGALYLRNKGWGY